MICERHQEVKAPGLCPICLIEERDRLQIDVARLEGWVNVAERRPPKKNRYYFVWVPEWEGYGNVAHADMCWWNGSGWSMGCLASVEDGAFVSHWMEIVPPSS